MTSRIPLLAAAFLAPAVLAAPATADAALVVFTGAAMNTSPFPTPGGGCPVVQVTVAPGQTSGASNFGAFTYSQAHCSTGGPGPYSGGVFQYFFAEGDMLSGTYSGLAALSGTQGLLNNTINLLVTGGTGRFLDGSGLITGAGTVDFRTGMAVQQLQLNGQLNLPAIPEPATWISMVAGFGGLGALLRRRRAAVLAA